MLDSIKQAVSDGKIKLIQGMVQEALDGGASAAEVLDAMTESGELVREPAAGQDACYLPELYFAECETARRIADLVLAGAPEWPKGRQAAGAQNPEQLIKAVEVEQSITLAPLQREILRLALRSRIVAVTGGPGTGKTTSLRALVGLFQRLGLKTVLAAPTGRAAKRMAELTGIEAATVHRLLGAKRSDEGDRTVFTKNRSDRLNCDALIVDECSMLDIRLMVALLEALPERARLVLTELLTMETEENDGI